MPFVVLQQVSSTYAKHNAARTLDKPIALKYLKKYLSTEDNEKLTSEYENGVVYIWGAKLERHHQIQKMIPRQTLVLFRRGQKVYRCSVIHNLIVNVELAEYLWDLDDDGEAWGIVYFMPEVKEISLSVSEVNSIIGRKANDNWQGMTSIEGDKAEKLITYVKSKIKSI